MSPGTMPSLPRAATAVPRRNSGKTAATLVGAVSAALAGIVAVAVVPSAARAQYHEPYANQSPDTAFDEFNEALDAHGQWVVHPRYGESWVPYANQDRNWRPYAYGQWVFTEEHGWYWESDEEFGWVVYHYGRWLLDDRQGWMWVPGREWGPAWVAWREGDDAIGWAPLPPEAEFDASGELVYEAFASPRYAPMWMFVAPAMLTMPGIYRHFYPRAQAGAYFGRTRYATFYGYRGSHVFNRGIDRRFIESRAQRPVPVLQVRPMAGPRDLAPGRRFDGGRHVGIYRPEMRPGGPGLNRPPAGFGPGGSANRPSFDRPMPRGAQPGGSMPPRRFDDPGAHSPFGQPAPRSPTSPSAGLPPRMGGEGGRPPFADRGPPQPTPPSNSPPPGFGSGRPPFGQPNAPQPPFQGPPPGGGGGRPPFMQGAPSQPPPAGPPPGFGNGSGRPPMMGQPGPSAMPTPPPRQPMQSAPQPAPQPPANRPPPRQAPQAHTPGGGSGPTQGAGSGGPR